MSTLLRGKEAIASDGDFCYDKDIKYRCFYEEGTPVKIKTTELLDLNYTMAGEYLAGFEYTLPFAQDETGDVGKLLGVSTMLPHTIIIDANGVVTYNAAGSLNYEELQAFVNQAMGNIG